MRVRRFAALIATAAVVAGVYAAYDPVAVGALWPAAGPLAMRLHALLPIGSGARAAAVDAPIPTAPSKPPVVVVVGHAARKDLPWRIDEIGMAQPIASVALRPHFDATVDKVLVADGAAVKAGDTLIELDARQVRAQIDGARAQLAKDQAALEQAQRDVTRYTDLVARGATPQLNLDNAKTAEASGRAAILADQAAIDNLQVQLGWSTIVAPISGRVGVVAIKEGNIAKASDNGATGILATINQISPIYVTFSVQQALLPALREGMANGARVEATPQGSKTSAIGTLALIDNSVDPTTGTILAHAVFDNPDETLWPGQLCNLTVTLRIEPNTVVVPREAVQVGQSGNYVFTVVDGVAHIQPVEVSRTQDGQTVVTKGLNGDETVVVDGALLLTEGAKVAIHAAQNGAT
jgi:membrane fusion protein, multidrug efflux system